MKRKVIQVDEELYPKLPGGALQIIDGKAGLISDFFVMDWVPVSVSVLLGQ